MKIINNRRGKVFYHYMLSYITILVIPLILSVAFYDKSRDIVNDESQRANELLLGQMTTYLDMLFSDAQQLADLISYNQRLEGLLFESSPLDIDDQYRLYQLSNEFELYIMANKNILDFYVYIPIIDKVITPWGSHSSSKYIEYWIPGAGLVYSDWLNQFSAGKRKTYLESRTELMDLPPSETVSVIYPLGNMISPGNTPGWLTIHIDKRYFRDVFKNTMWTDKTILIIYHEDSGIVMSSDPELDLSQADLPDPGYSGMFTQEVTLGDFSYIAMAMKSEADSKLHYVSLIPEGIYRDRFIDLTRFATVLFILAFLVGSYLIYRFSIARYKPVKRLLGLLNPSEGEGISLQSDEFALIANTMEMTIKEDKQLKEELKQSESIVAQRFMKQILKGTLKYDEGAENTLASYGVEFRKARNTLVLIDIELDEDAESDLRDRFIQELWFAEQRQSLFTIRDLDGAVGFLMNHDEGEFEELVRTIEMQKTHAESEHPLYLAIGISNVHDRDEDLSTLYAEAQAALDFRLVRSRKNPIRFSEVKTSNRSYYYPVQAETKMINSIKAGDRKAASRVLEEVYLRNFSKDLPNLEIARCLMFDLISTMIKTLNEIPTIEEDPAFWENIKPITTLMGCRSFDQLRTEMGEILERVCDYVIAGKPNKNDVLQMEIVQFVEKNFRDKNLSPELIASHLNRNKAYLCRFFREHEGIGISSYIKKYRVKIAKELMTDESIPVVEIADDVGFSGSNSFIRAFKEIEGVTPGQFLSSIVVR